MKAPYLGAFFMAPRSARLSDSATGKDRPPYATLGNSHFFICGRAS